MTKIFEIPENLKDAHVNAENYKQMYDASINDNENFWAKESERLEWYKKYDKIKEVDFNKADIKWFIGGKLNVSYNCIDRHLKDRKNQIAIIWEGDNPNEVKTISYLELYNHVNKLANVLKKYGVTKGDRVIIYLPMIPELAYACLACSRIGAVHSVVFGGFSAESLQTRINDCKPKLIITADGGFRGGKTIKLKDICDQAISDIEIKTCLIVKRTGKEINFKSGRDKWYHEEMGASDIQSYCPPEIMDAEDPLFILYTSGSTGTPKGVLHTTAGYLLYAAFTHHVVFDYRNGQTFWCSADIGWVTGHTYIVYGPLANGATTMIFEGVPSYPDFGRFWQIIEKHKVDIFFTAPTAIRALAREGDEWVNKYNLSSLKIIGTVGEPINPEAWLWYYRVVGNNKCPIVDTYWQTETGGTMFTPLPGATRLKPGSTAQPFFGIKPKLLDPTNGEEIKGAGKGVLCIADSWPGQMRTVYGDHKRFFDTYFSQYKGYYFTGDGCQVDEDGYYWITGRIDDVINVSGHRLGTAEIESALVQNEHVAEAAVIGMTHEVKGQGIYAFVTLNVGVTPSDELKKELILLVRKIIGPFAAPDAIQWASGLPKTRSGKIMRRILRKIVEKDEKNIGDTTTLADSTVVEKLIAERVI